MGENSSGIDTEWVRSTSGSDILRITVSKVQHAAIFRCARVVNIKLLGEHSIVVLLRVSLHWLVECDVDGVLLYHARLFYFIVMLIALSSTHYQAHFFYSFITRYYCNSY